MRQSWDLRPAGTVGRARLLFLALTGFLLCVAWGQTGAVWAQDEEKKEEPAAAKPKEAAAPAEPAEAPAAPKPPPASTTGDEGSKPPARENMLQWAIRASGPIGLFLLCLSVYFTAMVIRLFMEFRVSEAVPASLVERLEAAIRDKKFQEAYDVCKDSDSFLARLVRTGIANLPNGRAEAKEAMNTMTDEIVTGLEMKISYLATIGTLGPMIGLVGTVWGMIMSFQDNRHRRRRAAATREGGRGDLNRPVHHARGNHPVGAGDLLLRLLPQPDLADDHGSHPGGRSDHQLAGRGGQDLQARLSDRPLEELRSWPDPSAGKYVPNRI